MADLKEVPKSITKTLLGLPYRGSEWVALATITIQDANNIDTIVEGTYNALVTTGEGWIKLGDTLIKPEEYISFVIK